MINLYAKSRPVTRDFRHEESCFLNFSRLSRLENSSSAWHTESLTALKEIPQIR